MLGVSIYDLIPSLTVNVLGGNRTLDNLIKSQVLYRLSYKHTGGIGPLWVGYSRCASHTNAAYGYLNCNTRGKPSTHLKHITENTLSTNAILTICMIFLANHSVYFFWSYPLIICWYNIILYFIKCITIFFTSKMFHFASSCTFPISNK